MCILPHMDSALCTHCGPTQSLVPEGEEVQMKTGRHKSHEEAYESTTEGKGTYEAEL